MVASSHVRLVVASLEALDAEDRSAGALATALGVAPPVDWPPPFNDADTRRWIRGRLLSAPGLARWFSYYIVAQIDGVETVVGTCGFKGPPDDRGTVEIGYAIVPAYHRRGIGTAAVAVLVEIALSDQGVRRVTAETPVSFASSRALLEQSGFVVVSERSDPEDGDLVVYARHRT